MPIEIIGAQQEPPNPKPHCPECKTERPPYGFILNGGDLGVVGTVQYFTITCGAELEAEDGKKRICGCILGVVLTFYQPPRDPSQLAALQQALKGGPPQ